MAFRIRASYSDVVVESTILLRRHGEILAGLFAEADALLLRVWGHDQCSDRVKHSSELRVILVLKIVDLASKPFNRRRHSPQFRECA